MAGDGCMRCIRYLVFVFNFLFWFVGIGLFGLAMFLRFGSAHAIQQLAEYGTDSTNTLAYILMVVGGVLTMVGFMGCCGAYQESTCLLGTFFLCLLLMLVAQVAAAIYTYVERDAIREKYLEFWQQAANGFSWENRTSERAALNSKQELLRCCGAWNYTDYHNKNGFLEVYSGYPSTCCLNATRRITTTPRPAAGTTRPPNIDDKNEICERGSQFNEGCVTKLFNGLKDNLMWVGVGGVIVALLEIIGMVMAILLCCHLRTLNYEATAETENLMF